MSQLIFALVPLHVLMDKIVVALDTGFVPLLQINPVSFYRSEPVALGFVADFAFGAIFLNHLLSHARRPLDT